jgi:predicted house-cleaning noncanonical NTP pyrophosphatase (MazG superfamily)
MERIYNKLVRDNIPNIIKSKGETPVTRILSEDEYKNELEKKLYEEYKEVIEASGSDRIEELADMLEIPNVLTAQVTVTALTTSGVRRYEIAVDNENAQLHQTSLDVRADIVTGSELYRHLSMYGTTGTMIDKEVNQLNVWLGPVEEQT